MVRRLVVVMLVLLFVSSLVAALAPVRTPVDEPPADPDPRVPAAQPAVGSPKLVEGRIDADAKELPTISVAVGDQLRLEVMSRTPGTVELVGLGPTDDVDRFDPAVFDVLLTEEDTYPVRFLGTRKPIGTIEATEAKRRAPGR
ncbi:MAG: hypothetical protein M3383_08590 [Actinomycetota bacterium]|nr:hypothetical protein [Actinomycetota bacterium]